MPTTDHDLRSLLAEHSADGPTNVTAQRLSGVQSRVRRIKQRRAAAGSLAVVLLIVGVALTPGLFDDTRRKAQTVPAHQQKVAGGLLPRFAQGAEATAYTVFDADHAREKSFTFTFNPQKWHSHMQVECNKPLPKAYMVSYEINGKPSTIGHCRTGFSIDGPLTEQERQEYEQDYGLRPGKAVTVTARIIATPEGYVDDDEADADNTVVGVAADGPRPEKQPTYTGPLGSFRVAVALYTPVPRADYPFPPRPEKLMSLDDPLFERSESTLLGVVDSRETGPNGEGKVVVPEPSSGVVVDIHAIAPGTVQVRVNDVLLSEFNSWKWTGGGTTVVISLHTLRDHGLDVNPGDELTVVVAGRHFDVAGWKAVLYEDTGYDPRDDVCTGAEETPPCGKGLAEGEEYPYVLRTHCGIQGLYADGRYWVPVAGQDVGDHNPPAGFDEPVDMGTLVNVERGSRVEFQSSSGKVIVFEPGVPPSGECN